MRVTIYDKNPGEGFSQKFLATSWLVGCWIQKLFGKVDDYYGASSWDDALAWLQKQGQLDSIQYWGHGSPGQVYLAGFMLPVGFLGPIKSQVTPLTVVWFRTCSTFQGGPGDRFSGALANQLGCVIAGHTRVIGPLQGGLHTRKPNTLPSWPGTEGEFPASWWPSWARWGNNTVTCLATKIPPGW